MTRKNILIRDGFNIYNTHSLYNKDIVKIPDYVVQDVIESDKKLLIRLNEDNIALYTTQELKNNLVTVESRKYEGRFRNQPISYNLCQIKIVNDKNKNKKATSKRSHT